MLGRSVETDSTNGKGMGMLRSMGWQKFFRATRRADRLGIWWGIVGPGGVLVTAFGFVVQAFEPIAAFGWSAIVLASVLLALTTLLIISALLVAWRYFRPLPAPITSGLTRQDEPTRDFSAFDAEGLYVGEINVTTGHLEADYYFGMTVRAFNATGQEVEVAAISGHMAFRVAGSKADLTVLPQATFKKKEGKTFGQFTEIFVIIEQRVPSDVVKVMTEALSSGGKIELDLDSFDILISPTRDRGQSTRLPVWGGVILSLAKDRVLAGRIVRVTGRAVASTATVGSEVR
jgi:hypothetical protein